MVYLTYVNSRYTTKKPKGINVYLDLQRIESRYTRSKIDVYQFLEEKAHKNEGIEVYFKSLKRDKLYTPYALEVYHNTSLRYTSTLRKGDIVVYLERLRKNNKYTST